MKVLNGLRIPKRAPSARVEALDPEALPARST
jgi:hypothetical protein